MIPDVLPREHLERYSTVQHEDSGFQHEVLKSCWRLTFVMLKKTVSIYDIKVTFSLWPECS